MDPTSVLFRGYRHPFHGGKMAAACSRPLVPSIDDVNEWSYTSTPSCAVRAHTGMTLLLVLSVTLFLLQRSLILYANLISSGFYCYMLAILVPYSGYMWLRGH